MDKLANYGSDDDYEESPIHEQPEYLERLPGGRSTTPKPLDANYDDVGMDLSEDSDGSGKADGHRTKASDKERRRERRDSPKSSRHSKARDEDRGRDKYDRDVERGREKYDRDEDRGRDKYDRDEEKGRDKYDRDEERGRDKYERERELKDEDRGRDKYEREREAKDEDRGRDKYEKEREEPEHRERDDGRHRDREDKHRREKERDDGRERDRHRDDRRSKRSGSHERHRSRSPNRRPQRSNSRERGGKYGGYSRRYEKASNKMAHLEKMGIEIKTPDNQYTPMEKKEEAKSGSANENKFFLPGVSGRLREQMERRKLLWQKKEPEKIVDSRPQNIAPGSSKTGKVWEATIFAQDQDGKQASKFKRLMGIKESSASGGKTVPDIVKKQEELFSTMEQQYEVARTATHTMRGVGLGFGSFQR